MLGEKNVWKTFCSFKFWDPTFETPTLKSKFDVASDWAWDRNRRTWHHVWGEGSFLILINYQQYGTKGFKEVHNAVIPEKLKA